MMPSTAIQHHLLSVSDYYRMAEVNILAEDEHVELINGELFDMAPIGSFHAGLVTRLSRLLINQLGELAIVTVQNPLYLAEFSAPEPDIAVLKPRADDYMQSLPTAQDVLLLIEVADTSLHYDRNIKLPLYAKYQIPEVWLIDVKEKRLDIYQQPDNDYYHLHLRPKAKAEIQPLLVASVSLDWQALFSY
ncbi:MAG: Uma2 family endonuclease [Methylobacter sp.]|nr:Uma2 family endonuclease [Methylobacter sp.]MDP2097217.1 Uma2 family endonuclease [Methylobacter sp.]MDP2430011.1 Uma2 family endonuclease [Methylobacter sp.]MDP3054609.1 Uma2 family endonuclease [Methylobacter sp.]MDP3362984.1 Uma2 family endonuclease [Methylobacter sp.]